MPGLHAGWWQGCDSTSPLWPQAEQAEREQEWQEEQAAKRREERQQELEEHKRQLEADAAATAAAAGEAAARRREHQAQLRRDLLAREEAAMPLSDDALTLMKRWVAGWCLGSGAGLPWRVWHVGAGLHTPASPAPPTQAQEESLHLGVDRHGLRQAGSRDGSRGLRLRAERGCRAACRGGGVQRGLWPSQRCAVSTAGCAWLRALAGVVCWVQAASCALCAQALRACLQGSA
jgi:hypothetical protein